MITYDGNSDLNRETKLLREQDAPTARSTVNWQPSVMGRILLLTSGPFT